MDNFDLGQNDKTLCSLYNGQRVLFYATGVMRMFRYMDYIYSVYEERSFSRAAQKLHISQSSLSITVRRAEKKIGTQIFNRSTMPITLTDFGEKYIEAVKVIHTLQNDLDEYVLQLGSKIKGRVAI